MRTKHGLPIPDGTDLSTASSMRMFAEAVDAKVAEAWELHHAARHPDCAIIYMSSGSSVYSGAWTATGSWDTLQRSTLGNPADGSGMWFGNGGFPAGIYLVGGTLHYYTFGTPNGVDIRMVYRDATGTKYNIPVITSTTSTSHPSSIRGEEFQHFMIPAEFHMNPSGDVELEAYVYGGTRIDCQAARSRMWLWRVRGINNA